MCYARKNQTLANVVCANRLAGQAQLLVSLITLGDRTVTHLLFQAHQQEFWQAVDWKRDRLLLAPYLMNPSGFTPTAAHLIYLAKNHVTDRSGTTCPNRPVFTWIIAKHTVFSLRSV
jgi:hypothetical protein